MPARNWENLCRNPLIGHGPHWRLIPVEYVPKTSFAFVNIFNKRCSVCGYVKAILIASNGRRKSFYLPSSLPKGWKYGETEMVPDILDYARWLEEDMRTTRRTQRQKLRGAA